MVKRKRPSIAFRRAPILRSCDPLSRSAWVDVDRSKIKARAIDRAVRGFDPASCSRSATYSGVGNARVSCAPHVGTGPADTTLRRSGTWPVAGHLNVLGERRSRIRQVVPSKSGGTGHRGQLEHRKGAVMPALEEKVMKAWVLIVGALVSTSALAEVAPDTTTKTVATFEALDRNADRQISRTEAGYDRKLSKGFAFLDANGDGFLSPEEYAARTKS